jgi:hypothetical protein
MHGMDGMDVDDIRFKVAASRRMMFRADLDRDDVAGQVTFEARKVPHRANLTLLWDAHLRRLRRTDPDLFERVEALHA